MAVTVEWESDEQRMERCDHEGTTDALAGGSIAVCTVCGKTWPARFGVGAATVRIVSKLDGQSRDNSPRLGLSSDRAMKI